MYVYYSRATILYYLISCSHSKLLIPESASCKFHKSDYHKNA